MGKVKVKLLSHVRLFVAPWTLAHQAPPSMEFSRQEYWSGLPFPSPMHVCIRSCFSHVQLCATPWTAAHQAPLSIDFSRQEYWSGLPFILCVISSWTTGGSVEICKESGIIWIRIQLWFLISPFSLALSFCICQMVMIHLPHKTTVKFEI